MMCTELVHRTSAQNWCTELVQCSMGQVLCTECTACQLACFAASLTANFRRQQMNLWKLAACIHAEQCMTFYMHFAC
jgi:hypothetical protein